MAMGSGVPYPQNYDHGVHITTKRDFCQNKRSVPFTFTFYLGKDQVALSNLHWQALSGGGWMRRIRLATLTSTMKSEDRDVITIRKGCVKPVQMYYKSTVSGHRHIGFEPHISIIKNVRIRLACVTKEVQQVPDIPPIFKLDLERVRYLKNIFESPFETYIYLQEKYLFQQSFWVLIP